MRWWDVNQFQCRELFGMKCGLQKEYSIAQIGTFQSNTCIGIRDDCESTYLLVQFQGQESKGITELFSNFLKFLTTFLI